MPLPATILSGELLFNVRLLSAPSIGPFLTRTSSMVEHAIKVTPTQAGDPELLLLSVSSNRAELPVRFC